MLTYRVWFASFSAATVALLLGYLVVAANPGFDMARPLINSSIRLINSRSIFLNGVAGLSRAIPATVQNQLLFPSTANSRQSSFSTASVNMSFDKMSFKDAVLNRRTIYQLTNESTISDERIKEIVTTAIKHVPSSFNSQSTRLVVLLKDEHVKFWDIVTEILKAHVPADQWEHTAQRVGGFRAAYGSILFYEDPAPIKALQEQLPMYADRFPVWSEHTSAMHQFMLWTSFEAEGLGCSLQHYNPLPDQRASEIWNVPLEWSLKAQLVFGKPAPDAKTMDKQFKPVEERVFFHGASA